MRTYWLSGLSLRQSGLSLRQSGVSLRLLTAALPGIPVFDLPISLPPVEFSRAGRGWRGGGRFARSGGRGAPRIGFQPYANSDPGLGFPDLVSPGIEPQDTMAPRRSLAADRIRSEIKRRSSNPRVGPVGLGQSHDDLLGDIG